MKLPDSVIFIAVITSVVILACIVYLVDKSRNRYNVRPEAVVFGVLLILALGIFLRSPTRKDITSMWAGTSTVTPSPSPAPSGGTVFLKLPLTELAQLEDFGSQVPETTVPAQLIMVFKISETTTNGSTLVHHVPQTFCVEVTAFLDEQGARLPKDKENEAKSVMVAIETNELARYGTVEPDKVQMYLFPDPNCKN